MASSTLVNLAIAAVLGGATGGGLVWLSIGKRATSPAESNKSSPVAERAASPTQDPATQERLEQLEEQLSHLRREQQSRRALVEYAKSLSDSEQQGKDRPGAKPPRIVDAEDPAFELAVRTVLDRAEWERDEERRVQRQQRGIERTERQTEMLTDELGLDEGQREKVRTILKEQMNAFRSLRDSDEQPRPASRAEWRERLTKVRSQTEEHLGKVLDAEQLETYRKIAAEERERRWGPSRFGGEARGRDPAPERAE